MYLKALAILANLASMSTITTMSIPALADKSSASQRLNIAIRTHIIIYDLRASRI